MAEPLRRVEHITESTGRILRLSETEAAGLRAAGRELASRKGWWGDPDTPPDRSVIRCRRTGEGQYEVRVADAVGVVSVGSLQLQVEPKIPAAHLLYLFSRSGHFPRLSEQQAALATSDDLMMLVVEWYVSAAEALLRRELVHDYARVRDFVAAKRGKLNLLATARAYYQGRIGFDCSFDEFSADTPVNRVLRAAAGVILGRSEFRRPLRRRAALLRGRMPGVGPLRGTDLRVRLDRRTSYYGDAFTLARHVLQSTGRFIAHGTAPAWTFLIRTPEMVEAGLRNLVCDALGDTWAVEKRRLQLTGSRLRLEPDLVFGEADAVGDVKYKLVGSDWNRADLYQLVAYCTGFETSEGIMLAFRRPAGPEPPAVMVGPVHLQSVCWEADGAIAPQNAVRDLTIRLRAVLRGCSASEYRTAQGSESMQHGQSIVSTANSTSA